MGLSPVGEREVDGREEILHRRRSGWNAVVLSSHATYVGEALDVICPQQLIQSLARRSDISHARKTLRDRGDTLGLGGYIYIWLGAPLPVSSEYQHVHAITTQSQEHSRRSPALPVVLNLRQGQVLAKLVFVSIMQPVSDESSASSSASDPTRRLEDETDSLFRFLGTAVLLAELPAVSNMAFPDVSATPCTALQPRPRASALPRIERAPQAKRSDGNRCPPARILVVKRPPFPW